MRAITRIFFYCAFGIFHHASFAIEPIKSFYDKEIGVREATGRNDGARVEMYLQHVHLKKGNAWCAAFVSWNLSQSGIANPRSGWAPAYFPANRVIWSNSRHADKLAIAEPRSGDVFGIYFANKGRIAHVGFIDAAEGSRFITVEGNTNEAGSRDGDGVYRKRRLKSQIFKIARWD